MQVVGRNTMITWSRTSAAAAAFYSTCTWTGVCSFSTALHIALDLLCSWKVVFHCTTLYLTLLCSWKVVFHCTTLHLCKLNILLVPCNDLQSLAFGTLKYARAPVSVIIDVTSMMIIIIPFHRQRNYHLINKTTLELAFSAACPDLKNNVGRVK